MVLWVLLLYEEVRNLEEMNVSRSAKKASLPTLRSVIHSTSSGSHIIISGSNARDIECLPRNLRSDMFVGASLT